MRYKFTEVFQKNPNGSISPKIPVQIGGVTMSPGVAFTSGVSFSGVDIAQYQDKDIDGDIVNGILIIKGFYN
ncbi:hypothetical protein A2356_01985 [Candidatus Nomurabacteria bacterium RIFOXYB1_FULL_39_16]|uniref:Uncharacterized protein n=2 Tax=Candidatus Nomuraibacteriota TaxID=1752729 RepID=A0A0G0T7L4_9BACT|nr:MAG: hypothetical protein UT78_C0008G0012 [Candidatus Nomurabacteria bacterium GW2011_GWF2_40_12]OGJ09121.1 MAG: hypothetical protein A2356_01985 [Candidatus Nomurabacteria bacterium RIFOXYB1_FULL_39_16]OGJ14728.1 MAG: hypothetical protein A2585_01790 [Candidatus Nomurabacteria bacterium RIFOXYD1_FULL_39_12]